MQYMSVLLINLLHLFSYRIYLLSTKSYALYCRGIFMENQEQLDKKLWSGELVSPETIAEYLQQALSPDMLSGKQHYLFGFPGENRPYEVFFKLRIVCLLHTDKPILLTAAWDGATETRKILSGDILIGSSNALYYTPSRKISGKFFSVAFHTHFIRMQYIDLVHSIRNKNLVYHTPAPATGVLAQLVDVLDSIMHETSSPRQERCRPLIEAILRQLQFELLQTEPQIGFDHIPSLAFRIKYYMDRHYHTPINCMEVCNILNINRTYASGLFNKTFGMTMKDYLLKLRLDAAENLLQSGENIKIGQIAAYCGFSDTSYFIKVFRERHDATPAVWRAKCSNFF